MCVNNWDDDSLEFESGGAAIVFPFISNVNMDTLKYTVLPDDDTYLGKDINVLRKLMGALSSGLQKIHDAGIVHRDVKLENMLVGLNRGRGNSGWVASQEGLVPYWADFGFAFHPDFKCLEPDKGTSVGTPQYIAPEVALKGENTKLSDLYSFAMAWYYLLTDNPPFEIVAKWKKSYRSSIFWQLAHICKKPIKPSHWNNNLPRLVDSVMEKALEKDPSKRFQSAAELGEAFEDALKDMFQASLHLPIHRPVALARNPRRG